MMVYVHNTAFYNFGHKVTQNFRDIQIFGIHSFEKVSFGGKMRRKREISQINGRKKKLLRGVAVFNL